VDTTAGLWVVVEMSDAYRQAPPLAPLKWLTLTGIQAKGVMNLTLVAEATDAQALSTTVMIVEQGRQEGIREMQKAIDRQPMMAQMIKPILEMLKSVKVTQKDKKATLTATMKGVSPTMVLMPWMMVGKRTAQDVNMAPAQARPPAARPAPGGF